MSDTVDEPPFGEQAPAIRCPAIWVPDVEPCPAAELEPLLAWIAGGEGVEAETRFSRGTALPDGRLDLCKQSLGVDGALRVLKSIDGNACLRSLLLGTDGLGDRGAAAVADVVRERRAPALETLYLGCNRIEVAGVTALADALAEDHSPVRALWLKRNPVGVEGARVLARLIRARPELELLDLTNTALTEAGVEPIAAALIDQADAPRGLQRLLIGSNGVGPRGAAWLGEALAASPHLRELTLAVSPLGDAGVAALARGLARAPNSNIERLDLGSCGFGVAGLRALVDACRTCASLRELDLGTTPSTKALDGRDNDLRDREGAQLLADWLRDDPPLRRLDLSGAGVRSRGALALLDALADNHNLVHLRLGKYVARRVKRRIRERLEANAVATGYEDVPPPHVAAILSVYRSKPTGS